MVGTERDQLGNDFPLAPKTDRVNPRLICTRPQSKKPTSFLQVCCPAGRFFDILSDAQDLQSQLQLEAHDEDRYKISSQTDEKGNYGLRRRLLITGHDRRDHGDSPTQQRQDIEKLDEPADENLIE